MFDFAPYLTYAAALSIAAAIPGPGIAALVGQSLSGNIRAAMCFLAGLALGDVIFLTVAVVGLAAVAQTFAAGFALIKLAGAAYLIWLAWQFWTTPAGATGIQTGTRRSDTRAFIAGLSVTLGNPKTIVFYLAILPSVMDLNAVGLSMWATLAVLTVVILFAVLTPYVVLAVRARHVMTQPAALRRMNRIAGTILGGAGAVMIGETASAALRRM